MSTSRRTTLFLLLFAAYFGLLLLLITVQGLLDMAGLLSYRTSLLPFMLLHLLLLITFLILIFRTTSPNRERLWLQQHGRPATARLLDLQPTGWRIKKRGGGSLVMGHPGGPQREYRLHLEIYPPNATPYEATTHQYLSTNHLPEIGSTLPVKLHPHRPTRIILDEPPSTS